jgi:chromate transporter
LQIAPQPAQAQQPSAGSVTEVAAAFLKLGVSSFGGPIAHLGYFRTEFVERRRWLDEGHFGQLLALCQFLPGPASSQLGFSIGLLRAGWPGALAAFVAFTLPSALLLFAFAAMSDSLAGSTGRAIVHGLQLVAVAVVAQALVAMARALVPDLTRGLIAAAAAALVLAVATAWAPLLAIAGAAAVGPWLCRRVVANQGESFALHYGRRTGALLLIAFAALLLAAIALAPQLAPMGRVAGAFYRAGALVFGGGHVVLPMLQTAVVEPGWIDRDTFLAGYGAAQAVPGPMFSLSAFLGERLHGGQGGLLGAATSLLAIFLPGLLLVAGALPFWRALGARNGAARMLAGVNAAVVGLLAAALYDPVWKGAIRGPGDIVIAVVGFAMFAIVRWSPLVVVAFCVAPSVQAKAFGKL